MKATMPKVDDDLMDDGEGDTDEVAFDDDSDLQLSDESDRSQDSDGSTEQKLSLVEASDDDDLIPIDQMEPEALIEYDGSDAGDLEEEEWNGISGSGKRKRCAEEENRKKKKSRSLPTFASYEDYAKLIEQGPEDDI